MEINRMLGTEEAVVVGMEGGPGPTGIPTTTAAAEGAGGSGPRAEINGQQRPDPAVPERPVRRRFNAEYKARILREADQLTEPGQLGALLRREGLYSSHLCERRSKSAARGGVARPVEKCSAQLCSGVGLENRGGAAILPYRERGTRSVCRHGEVDRGSPPGFDRRVIEARCVPGVRTK